MRFVIPTFILPRHYRKVGWISGEVYCAGCGRGQSWPCPLARWHDRLKSALPIRWEDHPK